MNAFALSLSHELAEYRQRHPDEASVIERFEAFVASGEPLQGKTNPLRHVTSSAFIVDLTGQRTLLTHHARLGIWVQLGGHTDEGESGLQTALREAAEESGLAAFDVLQTSLFDLDIHTIPARNGAGAHEHYDLRYLLQADPHAPLTVSAESHDVAWVHLHELASYSSEWSLLRLAEKFQAQKKRPR